jgi:hypothetical protein
MRCSDEEAEEHVKFGGWSYSTKKDSSGKKKIPTTTAPRGAINYLKSMKGLSNE